MKELKPIPFNVIISAINDDESALKYVLDHYRKYICSLSTKTVVDQHGVTRTFLDEHMKAHLENKLIYSITVVFKLPQNN